MKKDIIPVMSPACKEHFLSPPSGHLPTKILSKISSFDLASEIWVPKFFMP